MPTGWHEVSFNDAMTIKIEDLNHLQAFSLLSGIPYEEVRELEDYETVACFIEAFGFIKRWPDPREAEVPWSMKLGEKRLINPSIVYDDLKDMGKMNMGQIEDMKALYLKELTAIQDVEDEDWRPTETEILEIMPSIVAVFVQKIKDRRYDYQKAVELIPVIKEQMSFKDVTSMGYFFFQRLNALVSGSKKAYRKPNWIERKLKRGSRSLMMNLDSMLH